MQKPTPADFDLTPEQVQRFTRLDERAVPRLFVWVCGLSGIGGAIYGVWLGGLSLETPIAVIMFAAQAFAMALLPSLVLGAYWQNLLGFVIPSLARYVRFTAAVRAYEKWELRTRIEFWRGLSGRGFESELAATLSRLGYEVALTPASGDGGVDIVLKKDGRAIIVQCKATTKPVGPAVARELYGTLLAIGADEAVLAATAGVTEGVRQFVADKPIRVLGLPEIVALHSGNDYPLRYRLAATV